MKRYSIVPSYPELETHRCSLVSYPIHSFLVGSHTSARDTLKIFWALSIGLLKYNVQYIYISCLLIDSFFFVSTNLNIFLKGNRALLINHWFFCSWFKLSFIILSIKRKKKLTRYFMVKNLYKYYWQNRNNICIVYHWRFSLLCTIWIIEYDNLSVWTAIILMWI